MSTTTLATTVLGSSRLLESGRLRGKRVGIVANPASIDQQFVHVVDRLVRADGVTLGAIFGPQHGFDADLQENMIETPHAESRAHRVKVYSLYSETREPTPAMLDGLDVLVVDLQDVGTRIYTFIYTMAYCLTGAAKAGIPVIVCDRPNPIGGVGVEGPMLERGFESFVGLYPIPMRHGLTIGELARLFNEVFGLGADLTVEPMSGWSRQMFWDDTDVPWVLPSPNMPTLETAIVYPGQVLFEGTMLSEARGTTRPFELCGAPGLDANALASALNAYRLPGAQFRPVDLRADVPQAREDALPRRPDPRHRPPHLRAGPGDHGGLPRDAEDEPGGVRLASAALRVRAQAPADRHPRRHRDLPRGHRARHGSAADGGVVEAGGRRVRAAAAAVPAVLGDGVASGQSAGRPGSFPVGRRRPEAVRAFLRRSRIGRTQGESWRFCRWGSVVGIVSPAALRQMQVAARSHGRVSLPRTADALATVTLVLLICWASPTPPGSSLQRAGVVRGVGRLTRGDGASTVRPAQASR